MANLQLSAAGVLGVNVLGATATAISNERIWLIVSIVATCAIGLVAVVLSLIARWYRR